MKKLLIVLSLLLFSSQFAFADETQLQANQTQTVDTNKAVISVQKQPVDEKSKQKQNVKNNWFCIVIQVNGKVVDGIK